MPVWTADYVYDYQDESGESMESAESGESSWESESMESMEGSGEEEVIILPLLPILPLFPPPAIDFAPIVPLIPSVPPPSSSDIIGQGPFRCSQVACPPGYLCIDNDSCSLRDSSCYHFRCAMLRG